jgi:hypothetical protein
MLSDGPVTHGYFVMTCFTKLDMTVSCPHAILFVLVQITKF